MRRANNNNYYVKVHLKPYYGLAGVFCSFEIDSCNLERRHLVWFDDSTTEIRSIIYGKIAARCAVVESSFQHSSLDFFLHSCFNAAQTTLDVEDWLVRNAAQMQSLAVVNDTELL